MFYLKEHEKSIGNVLILENSVEGAHRVFLHPNMYFFVTHLTSLTL